MDLGRTRPLVKTYRWQKWRAGWWSDGQIYREMRSGATIHMVDGGQTNQYIEWGQVYAPGMKE